MSDKSRMTFGIIKPDAVRAGNTGAIIQRITENIAAAADLAK